MLKNRVKILFSLFIFLLSFSVFQIKAVDLSSLSPNKLNDYLQLPRKKTVNIISSLKNYFDSEWRNSIAFNFPPEHQAIFNIMKNVSAKNQFQYLFFELPQDIAWKFLNITFNVAKEYFKTSNFDLLTEIETISVSLAQRKVLNLILENEIKMTPGAIDISYLDQNNQWQNAIFQYLLISQKYNNEEEIFMRFFSPYQLEPPTNRGSVGGSTGYATLLTDKIPPFILDVKGKMKDEKWLESPIMTISFPKEIPDFGLKPQGFLERNIIVPFKENIKKFFADLETGGPFKIFYISRKNKNIKKFSLPGSDKIKSFLFSLPILGGEATKNINEYLTKENAKEDVIIYSQNNALKNNQKLNQEISLEKQNIISESPSNKNLQNNNAPNNTLSNKKEIENITLCPIPSENTHLFSQVIFNEIAWMGTKESPNNEWIELKNISAKSQNLKNWQIQNKSGKIKIILKEHILAQGSFFILERTDDNTLPNIKADQIFDGAILNSNEALFLFDQNCNLQDMVFANPNWPAGDNLSKRTMERKKFDFNWQTSENLGGTPKSENSFGYFPQKETKNNQSSQNQKTNETTQNSNVNTGSKIGSGIAPMLNQNKKICNIDDTANPQYLPVIFNEINWMGTNSNSYDEWIELKNLSTNTINLKNWQILGRKMGETNLKIQIIIDKEFNILPNQFFFLEKNSSNPGFSNFSDLFYSGSLLIDDNPNFELYLFDENCNLIDKISATSSWPAGQKNPERKSMERDKDLNWQTCNSSSSTNGLFCTPKDENSIKNQNLTLNQIKEGNDILAKNIIISEVNIKNNEFIELYNPTENEVDPSNYYLVYYTGKETTTSEELLPWNKPYKSLPLVETTSTTIPAFGYFLIALDKNFTTGTFPTPDFSTSSIQLSDDKGSIGIFSCDPKSASTSKEAEDCKIDLFSWQNNKKYFVISEKNSFFFKDSDIKNKSFQRKQNQANFYIDNNDNSTDFEISFLTPTNSKNEKGNFYPPETVKDFKVSNLLDNSVLLTWSPSEDIDTSPQNISYLVFYSKNLPITKENAKNNENIISVVATNTQIIISDLFYNSTYYFGIFAFDGLNFSEIATTSIEIPAEIPQWQSFGGDTFHTFKSQFLGPKSCNLKFILYWPKDEIGDITTGPVIDQNGTIYVGEKTGLVAVSKEGKIKWKYPSEKIIGNPAIGKDGSIYFSTFNFKIYSISPSGKLNWELDLKKVYSGNEVYDCLGNSIFYSLQILDDKIFYLFPKIDLEDYSSTTISFLIINTITGNIEKEIELPQEENNKYSFSLAKTPLIAENIAYIPVDNLFFAIDLNTGNLIWKKYYGLDCNETTCKNKTTISNIAFDSENKKIIIAFDSLQQLYSVPIENGSLNPIPPLACNNFLCKSFFILSDIEGNTFSRFPMTEWGSQWLKAKDSNGSDLWQFGPYDYSTEPAGYFNYPLAISKEGILYAPISGGLLAIGE